MLDVLLQQFQRPPRPGAGGALVTGLNFVSIGLLLALVVVFLSTWRKTKAPFMLGLTAFAATLLLTDVLRVAFVFGFTGLGAATVLPDALEILALAVLLYLATR